MHFITGLIGLVLFISSGVYMLVGDPPGFHESDVSHVLYRANHIYLLMSGLIHLVLSRVARRGFSHRRTVFATAGTWISVAGWAILVAAFLIEPRRGTLDRPLTQIGVVLLAVGAVTVLICTRGGTRTSARASE